MEVVVPDLGDFSDVEVIEVLVSPGDQVEPESPLITLETDKAAMDVPSPQAGTVSEIKVANGDRVSAGDVIVILKAAAGSSDDDASAVDPSADEGPADDGSADAAAADGKAAAEDAQAADSDSDSDSDSEAGADDDEPAGPADPEDILVPDLGDFSDVEVIDVLVSSGDAVEAEGSLITLETDKAAMDVPSPRAGVINELKVAKGDRVSTGDVIAVLQPSAAKKAAKKTEKQAADKTQQADTKQKRGATAAAPAARKAPAGKSAFTQAVDEKGFGLAHASPSVRKLARELGVDLARVDGSGQKGRVTADDVKAYVKSIMLGGGPAGAALPEVPEVDFARFGKIETVPLSRIQKISGPRLHASWVNVPHVTQHDLADITELELKRKALKEKAAEQDIKLTPLAFIVKACVLALKEFPALKSSLAPGGDGIVMKHYTHIGFAADTPNGLVVPVIRDADKLNVFEIADALGKKSAAARDGKLKVDDMQGGVFTISSLGGIGGTAFTPIINAPEVAILGVARSSFQPVYEDGEFVPRLMLPLSLSYDHRVIDGAMGVRFTTHLGGLLADVDTLMEGIE